MESWATWVEVFCQDQMRIEMRHWWIVEVHMEGNQVFEQMFHTRGLLEGLKKMGEQSRRKAEEGKKSREVMRVLYEWYMSLMNLWKEASVILEEAKLIEGVIQVDLRFAKFAECWKKCNEVFSLAKEFVEMIEDLKDIFEVSREELERYGCRRCGSMEERAGFGQGGGGRSK